MSWAELRYRYKTWLTVSEPKKMATNVAIFFVETHYEVSALPAATLVGLISSLG